MSIAIKNGSRAEWFELKYLQA